MNIMIVGCGKVGSNLAMTLSAQGHEVAVVDRDKNNMQRLSDDFSGIFINGVPIDQDVLRSAGIETCDAVAAVTENDNVNIMVSQLAREIFKVKRVIARVYDPVREGEFSHYGLQTICPTNLTVETICSTINEDVDRTTVCMKSHSLSFVTRPATESMVGKELGQLSHAPDESVFALLREGQTLMLAGLADAGKTLIEKGDSVIYAKIID